MNETNPIPELCIGASRVDKATSRALYDLIGTLPVNGWVYLHHRTSPSAINFSVKCRKRYPDIGLRCHKTADGRFIIVRTK
jgi:hypothetical protein